MWSFSSGTVRNTLSLDWILFLPEVQTFFLFGCCIVFFVCFFIWGCCCCCCCSFLLGFFCCFLLEGTIPALELNKTQVCQIGVSFVLRNTSVMLNFMVFALSLCFLKCYRAVLILKRALKQSDPTRIYRRVYDGSSVVKSGLTQHGAISGLCWMWRFSPTPSAYKPLLPHHFWMNSSCQLRCLDVETW